MTLRFLPAADKELVEAAQWYEDRCDGMGVRFLSAIIQTCSNVEKHPLRYPPPPGRTKRDVRRAIVDGFPYLIVYEIRGPDLIVIAVAHARRRPGYWNRRGR